MHKNVLICEICKENPKRKIVCDQCREREGLKQARKKQAMKCQDTEKSIKSDLLIKKLNFTRLKYGKKENCQEENYERFEHVEQGNNTIFELIVGEPVFDNPNSYETVAKVLRHIGHKNGMKKYGGQREWTIIVCDGLPASLIWRMKNEAVICEINKCGQTFLSKKELAFHTSKEHDNQSPQFNYEFDWFYLLQGYGHYELNLMRSFFELNWPVFMERFCEIMGFTSEPAKHVAKCVKDHHIGWQLLLSFHMGALRELVTPYVRECLSSKHVMLPTPEGFMQWTPSKCNQDSKYHYLHDQVLRYSQGIINFRAGVRRCNSELRMSAKFMTKELFHGRNHPCYQNLEVMDVVQSKFMPVQVKHVFSKYSSVCTSNNKSAGQGLDYQHEQINRWIKSHLPDGIVPQKKHWMKACHYFEALKKVKEKTLEITGTEDSCENATKVINISEAITAWRVPSVHIPQRTKVNMSQLQPMATALT